MGKTIDPRQGGLWGLLGDPAQDAPPPPVVFKESRKPQQIAPAALALPATYFPTPKPLVEALAPAPAPVPDPTTTGRKRREGFDWQRTIDPAKPLDLTTEAGELQVLLHLEDGSPWGSDPHGAKTWLLNGVGCSYCTTAPGHMALSAAGRVRLDYLLERREKGLLDSFTPPPPPPAPTPPPPPSRKPSAKKAKADKPLPPQPVVMTAQWFSTRPIAQIEGRWYRWENKDGWRGWKDLDPADRTWINHSNEPPQFDAKDQLVGRVRPFAREVKLEGWTIPLDQGAPEPQVLHIRGVRCIVVITTDGFATYATEPGPFWSPSGFRNFRGITRCCIAAGRAIEAYIDEPQHPNGVHMGPGGLGGQLFAKWSPFPGSRYEPAQEPPETPSDDDTPPEAPTPPPAPSDAPSPVLEALEALADCQVRGALRQIKDGLEPDERLTSSLAVAGWVDGQAGDWVLTAQGEDQLQRLDDEHYAQLDEEAEVASAEAVAELIESGDLEPDEVMEGGEAVVAEVPAVVGGEAKRSYWDLPDNERRKIDRARRLQMDAEEWAKMNEPAADLDKSEATAEALALYRKLEWRDDGHRYRTLYRLRLNRTKKQADDANFSTAKKPKVKPHLIEASAVELQHAVTRARPLAEIADDAWDLVDRYDRAMREGTKMEGFHLAFDRLKIEANQGTSFGVLVHEGPRRLMRMLLVRAGRAGRLPMWGLRQKFRLVVRGMHVVVDNGFGLGFHLDETKAKPGSPCWSETGYRSFGGSREEMDPVPGQGLTPEGWAQGILERYIDQPKGKDGAGGLGGQLIAWYPHCVREWHQAASTVAGSPKRDMWEHLGKAEQAAIWAKVDARIAKAEAECRAIGVDPRTVYPDLARKLKPQVQAALL